MTNRLTPSLAITKPPAPAGLAPEMLCAHACMHAQLWHVRERKSEITETIHSIYAEMLRLTMQVSIIHCKFVYKV